MTHSSHPVCQLSKLITLIYAFVKYIRLPFPRGLAFLPPQAFTLLFTRRASPRLHPSAPLSHWGTQVYPSEQCCEGHTLTLPRPAQRLYHMLSQHLVLFLVSLIQLDSLCFFIWYLINVSLLHRTEYHEAFLPLPLRVHYY